MENNNLPDKIDEQVADRIVKRKNSKKLNFGQENIEPGDNTRYLRHALANYNLPPIDLDSDEQVQERIYWYFNHCMEDDMKPTVQGLANSLGISRFTLHDWYSGKTRGVNDNRTAIINQAYNLLQELWEDYMLNGKINPVSGIFIGKNHFGYTDKQEVVVTPHNPLDEVDSPEIVSQRYIESVAED